MSNHYTKQNAEPVSVAVVEKDMHVSVWLLLLMISLLFSFSTGLFLIWMSIDRTELAYNILKTQNELDSGKGHIVKLEVEKDSLLSPYELDKKAQELGLRIADPGQVRRLMN